MPSKYLVSKLSKITMKELEALTDITTSGKECWVLSKFGEPTSGRTESLQRCSVSSLPTHTLLILSKTETHPTSVHSINSSLRSSLRNLKRPQTSVVRPPAGLIVSIHCRAPAARCDAGALNVRNTPLDEHRNRADTAIHVRKILPNLWSYAIQDLVEVALKAMSKKNFEIIKK